MRTISVIAAIAFVSILSAPAADAADLGAGIAPDVVVGGPAVPGAGAVMFSPATAWPSRYIQTHIVQQPAPGISVYEYDALTSTAPPIILVVPPARR